MVESLFCNQRMRVRFLLVAPNLTFIGENMNPYENTKEWGNKCSECEHDEVHHEGHGECLVGYHTTKRCSCKTFNGIIEIY